MKTADFNFELPEELIAQNPVVPRDSSKLMVLRRKAETITGSFFNQLPSFLEEGDVLVFNQSKVIPARICFDLNGKTLEVFLLKELAGQRWQALVRPGKKFKLGAQLMINDSLRVEVEAVLGNGVRVLKFDCDGRRVADCLEEIGEMPLPPYIKNSSASFEQYQTVYAKDKGSVAAPTAGLHFTDQLLGNLQSKGVQLEYVTLHVGMGTFMPVKTDDLKDHQMHSESLKLDAEVAKRLNQAKSEGRRIIAVGTTAVRVLESAADPSGMLIPGSKDTEIFIYPGYQWRFVDGLITNFHLPKSTLLMLVSALAGRDFMMTAYQKAIAERYRFFSFGDGMLIV